MQFSLSTDKQDFRAAFRLITALNVGFFIGLFTDSGSAVLQSLVG